LNSTVGRLPLVIIRVALAVSFIIPFGVNHLSTSVQAKSEGADTGLNPSVGFSDPEAAYQGARVVHDVYMDGKKGMRVHAAFTVRYGIGVPCRLIAYFYYDDGNARQLKSSDPKYSDSGGGVAVGVNFKPASDPAVYDDFQVFVPYDALNMAPGDYDLKFQLKLYDQEGNRFFGQSSWYRFHHAWNSPTSPAVEKKPRKGSDPEATYEGARVVHDVYVDGRKGMRVHANFTVRYGIGVACRLIAYFYYDDGSAKQLKSVDPKYSDSGGGVAVTADFKPTKDPAVYRDYELFVPHDALNMAIGDYDLKFQLKLYDLEGKRFFGQSDWYKFHLSKGVAGSAPERRGDSGARAEWTSVPGPAGVTVKQIAVGSSTYVYALDTGGTLYRWNGSGWDKKKCCVSQISVGSDGELWATNPADSLRVLRWDGYEWTWNIPTGMKQVAVRDRDTIYALDNDGTLYRWNGSRWDKKRCCVSQISVGSDGELWGTNSADSLRVLRWDGSNWTSNIPPGMTLVTIGDTNNIWAVDASDQVFRWDGSAWKHVQGSLRSISAGRGGSVWGLDSQGVIYRHN